MNKQTVIVDVDNILYDFHTPWHEELCKMQEDFPAPDKWTTWHSVQTFGLPKNKIYEAARKVYERQMDFEPFHGAFRLLKLLSDDYLVIIGTQRNHADSILRMWLDINHLRYHGFHSSTDKTVLFSNCALVIDDSPIVLQKAKDAGIEAFGISYPWNKDRGFKLFPSLASITEYLFG